MMSVCFFMYADLAFYSIKLRVILMQAADTIMIKVASSCLLETI